MQIRYLPALTMLIAGAVGCVMGIVNHYDISYMMKMEIIVMIIFYFVGKLAKKIIMLVLNNSSSTIVEEQNMENNTTDNIDAAEK